MEKSEIKDYLILLNYIKSNNYAIRLKEKNKIQNEKIKVYANKCNELIKKQNDDYKKVLKSKNEKICELEKEIEKIKNRIS